MFISCLLLLMPQLGLHIFMAQLILTGFHSGCLSHITPHAKAGLFVSHVAAGIVVLSGCLLLILVSVYCSNSGLSGLCMSGYAIIPMKAVRSVFSVRYQ